MTGRNPGGASPADDEDEEDEEDAGIRTVKLALKTILQTEHKKVIESIMFDRCLAMTEIASLASLLL